MSNRTMSRVLRTTGIALAVALLVMPTMGCASSKAKNRMKVLNAENVDLRQQRSELQGQVHEWQSQADRSGADLQQAQHENGSLKDRATLAESQAQQAMDEAHRAAAQRDNVQAALADTQRTQDDLLAKLDAQQRHNMEARRQLEEARARLARGPVVAPRPAVAPTPHADAVDPAALVAFQRDLQGQLSRQGIHAPVEIRTSARGDRRVAVILPDAFKAGKATLAYNADAVTTVVRLGELVQTHYPQSAISVEGHTDSDPIRRSGWRDNQHLSQARAEHVAKLLSDTGIESGRIGVTGAGASRPIDQGSDGRAKSRNRRVELFIDPR